MSWRAVKDIKVRKWNVWQGLRHSRAGQVVRVRKLAAAAMSVLDEARTLASVSDAELLDRAQRMHAQLSADPGSADRRVFPLIVEAIRRQTSLTLHPNQVVAAMAMSQGQMVELATGEGKTLVTMLTATARALGGRRIHVFTANRYLAHRDAELASAVAARLGLRVGSLRDDLPPPQRRSAYRCPILYATLAEVAFDWLRDRLAMCRGEPETLVPPLDLAIVDEADMVMIDDARTPLVLAERTAHDPTELYRWAVSTVDAMKPVEDYTSSQGRVELTRAAARWFRSMSDEQKDEARQAVLATLRARLFYRRNVHYAVQDDEVVIVDEKTGRLMPGRRWHEGLHEAVTVLEGLPLDGTQQNIAQITVQQYLAQYAGLCGCSGTMAEATSEMYCVYGLSTLRVPTHRRCRRKIWKSVGYATRGAQFRAAVEQIKALRSQGRPVLVGSTHIATSERLSAMLRSEGVEHELLTALEEEHEAQIVERAGRAGAVTIATNMAGRGTDIKLDPQALAAGGLHVISLQRHDSSRVDRQLIGRGARQGDPGSSQFILCIQDPLLGPHVGALRRKHLTPATRAGDPISSRRPLRLWGRRQRDIELQHLLTRIGLIQREASLQAMYGKPYYLADQPPIRARGSLV